MDRNVHQLEEKSYIIEGNIKTYLKDIDQNGTTELIIRSNPVTSGDIEYHGPWRDGEDIFTWNGNTFSHLPVKLDPPVYRFQAVDDGDRAFLNGENQMALKFYRQAIDDPHLKGWSIAHFENMQRSINASWNQESTPTPPPDDPNERANLSAYAHFRIVLAYTALGELEKAREVYDLMQQKYPGDEPGNAYVQLTSTFLKGYESSGSLEDGCASVIDFAIHHEEEILSPIAIEWHGWQSLNYKFGIRDGNSPICPFVAAK